MSTGGHTYTPEPWLPARLTAKLLNVVQVGETFRCTVVGGAEGDAKIVATVHGETEQECAANARLIAAAPEMLTLLQDIRRFYVAEFDAIYAQDDIDALIARIEGSANA